jgi:hypothetical protein
MKSSTCPQSYFINGTWRASTKLACISSARPSLFHRLLVETDMLIRIIFSADKRIEFSRPIGTITTVVIKPGSRRIWKSAIANTGVITASVMFEGIRLPCNYKNLQLPAIVVINCFMISTGLWTHIKGHRCVEDSWQMNDTELHLELKP